VNLYEMAPKLFPLISSSTPQKRRPFDKLLNRNTKKYHGYNNANSSSPSPTSARFSAFKVFAVVFFAALFLFYTNRSAKMFSLASKYSNQILENESMRMPSKTTQSLIIHDPHPDAAGKDGDSSNENLEKPNELVDNTANENEPSDEDSDTTRALATEEKVTEIEEGNNNISESNMESESAETNVTPMDNGNADEKASEGENFNNDMQDVADAPVDTFNNDAPNVDGGDEEGNSPEYGGSNNSDSSQIEPKDPDVFLKDAPLHAMNPTGEKFKAYDINAPTKIEVPENGFPPRSLPVNHAYHDILNDLRQKTDLHPRWPDHPELHLAKLKSYGPAYASIIISDKLKVVYVPVFKVGTTSMMWNIAYLENNPAVVNANIENEYVRDYILHDFNSKAWSNHAIYALSSERVRSTLNDPSYLKFGFVRNPYHRVVSAYLDKVVKWPFNSAEYQGQMYGLYGTDFETRKFRNHTKPSFKEYLNAIEKVITSPRTKTEDLTKHGSYEDNNSRREIHFRPQVELLHPDLIHFDFIGRFDNMKNDTKEVLQWMYKSTDRRMPDNNRRRLHSTDPEDKIAIFERLHEDEEMRNTLLRIYKDDFQRFGFSKEIPDAKEHKD